MATALSAVPEDIESMFLTMEVFRVVGICWITDSIFSPGDMKHAPPEPHFNRVYFLDFRSIDPSAPYKITGHNWD